MRGEEESPGSAFAKARLAGEAGFGETMLRPGAFKTILLTKWGHQRQGLMRTAQTLNSGILAMGSKAAMVRRLAGASR